jgi:hypothetical protein
MAHYGVYAWLDYGGYDGYVDGDDDDDDDRGVVGV